MIFFGSGGKATDLGVVETRKCSTCEKDRPFKLIVEYRYAHIYWLKWVTQKAYRLACDVCRRGWVLKDAQAKEIERTFTTHPIPFMHRFGWTFLIAGVLAVVGLTKLSINRSVPEAKTMLVVKDIADGNGSLLVHEFDTRISCEGVSNGVKAKWVHGKENVSCVTALEFTTLSANCKAGRTDKQNNTVWFCGKEAYRAATFTFNE